MRLLCFLFPLTLLGQFDYERGAPLDARPEPMSERATARIWGGTFAGTRGARVSYVMVEPKLRGRAARVRHPGVLFQHGGGQSMSNYVSEALILAELGVTSLLVDAVGAESRESLVELVITERRALDLLLRQVGVDAKRIGYAGHSYGGFAGAVLTGMEPRISAFVLMGAVPSLARHIRESESSYWAPMRARPDLEHVLAGIVEVDADRYLPRARAAVLVQCARFDTPDNMKACPEVHRLAGGPKTLTWYDDDHNFSSFEAMRDRLYWLAGQFKLRGLDAVLQRWARKK
ncbi:MAG: alpha/beta hydrolase family protein [Bryobacteraceae bacterium]